MQPIENLTNQTSLSVIVVTYYTGPYLKTCLERLSQQAEVSEIIVVDNGNEEPARTWLKKISEASPRIKLLCPGRNTGFAFGCNLGAASAKGDYIALVNPDLEIPDGTFRTIFSIFERHPDAWLCGGRLLNMDGTEQRGGRRETLTPWRAFVELSRLDRLFPDHPYFRRLHKYEDEDETGIVEVSTVSGAFMVIRKRHYEALRGMDDNLFLHFDDSDLCIRISKAGGKVLYCGNVPVFHHLSTSDVSRTFVEWHKARSSSYYFYKHFSDSYPWWGLSLLSLLLKVRFVALACKALPHDLRWLLRRWMGKIRPASWLESGDESKTTSLCLDEKESEAGCPTPQASRHPE